jgi:hypothetical protein
VNIRLITLLKPCQLAKEPDFRKTYVTPGKPKPKRPGVPSSSAAFWSELVIRHTRAATDAKMLRIAASVPVTPVSTMWLRIVGTVFGFPGVAPVVVSGASHPGALPVGHV